MDLSSSSFGELEDMIAEDQKKKFRYKQIAEEGNDPVESGKAYGTPHQIASLYGGSGKIETLPGYDETKPGEKRKLPGRPQVHASMIGTDSDAFGRDRYGSKEWRNAEDSGEDKMGLTFKGGPMNMESTMNVYLQNKEMLGQMAQKKFAKRVNLFEEESNILSEDNIKSDSE